MNPYLRDLLVEAQPLVGGAYIMTPASAPDLAGEVLEAISVPIER